MKENYLDMLLGNPNNEEALNQLLPIFLKEHPETLDDDEGVAFERWLTYEMGARADEIDFVPTRPLRNKPGITSDPVYPPKETEEDNEGYKREIK
jgi:hypothetical protein